MSWDLGYSYFLGFWRRHSITIPAFQHLPGLGIGDCRPCQGHVLARYDVGITRWGCQVGTLPPWLIHCYLKSKVGMGQNVKPEGWESLVTIEYELSKCWGYLILTHIQISFPKIGVPNHPNLECSHPHWMVWWCPHFRNVLFLTEPLNVSVFVPRTGARRWLKSNAASV